jgi:hypothetical protein
MTLFVTNEAESASKWADKVISFRWDCGVTGKVRNNACPFRYGVAESPNRLAHRSSADFFQN